MYNFNNRLIRSLMDAGHEVLVVVPHGPYIDHLSKIGCRVIVAPLTRKSINPVVEVFFYIGFFASLVAKSLISSTISH